MTTAWAYLPNAALIDEVLASVKARPDKWVAAWNTTWVVSQGAVWYTAWSAAWNAVQDAGRGEAWDAIRAIPQNTAWDTTTALIAYDDAGQFMKMPIEHLQRLYRIDPHPMYWLLQPAAVVFAED